MADSAAVAGVAVAVATAGRAGRDCTGRGEYEMMRSAVTLGTGTVAAGHGQGWV